MSFLETFFPENLVYPVYPEYTGDVMVENAPIVESTIVQTGQTGGFFGISMSFIARLLIATFFIIMGIRAAMNFSEYKGILESTGIPYAGLIAILSIFLQIVGGLFFTGILAIYNSVSWGKLFLIIYTIVSTAVNFNAFKDPSKLVDMLKNLAILGGLFLA